MSLKLITPTEHRDNRGYFIETYNETKFNDLGIVYDWHTDGESWSPAKGTVRGLHFQRPFLGQAKLIRCTQGGIKDVIVDIRKGSPTYGNVLTIELGEWANEILYVPLGFAHGFITTREFTQVLYKLSQPHNKAYDMGINFLDPAFGDLTGPMDITISEKDKNLPFLKDLDSPYIFGHTDLPMKMEKMVL